MSILIKGMEMPKGLGKTITIYPNGMVRVWANNKGSGELLEQRAVPVPEHGRLIDADAFVRFIKSAIERHSYRELKLKRGLTVKDVLDAVIADLEGSGVVGFANAPTIIPADKEDQT